MPCGSFNQKASQKKKIQLEEIIYQKIIETCSELEEAHKDHQVQRSGTATKYDVNDTGLAQIKCEQGKEYSVS